MKRFTFRLETVLRHREILSEQREQEFALAQGRYEVAKNRLSDLEAHYRETVANRPGADSGSGFNAAAIQSRERYLEALGNQIEQQSELTDISRMISEEKRAQMVTARQAKEAVSRLRDKDLAAYRTELERKTQEALDEIASVRFLRQKAAETALRGEHEAARAKEGGSDVTTLTAEPDGRKAA